MLPDLVPGDVLLYRGTGWVSQAIRIKTWSDVSHAELYVGEGRTVTARLKGGADYFRVTDRDLAYIYRPHHTWAADPALAQFDQAMRGQKYDLLGLLLSFYAVRQGRDNRRAFCSEVVTRVLRWGHVEPFAIDFDADAVAPAQFKQTPALWRIYP